MHDDDATRTLAGYAERFDREAPVLFAWASVHLRPAVRARLDPEDLLQEVACRAYEHFARYDADKGTFRNWVFGIARNVLREALRTVAAEPVGRGAITMTHDWADDLRDTATSISRAVARDEALLAFVTRIDGLTDEERALVLYRGLEGRPHAEVGELLGLSADNAAKRWQRLRDRLRGEQRIDELLNR